MTFSDVFFLGILKVKGLFSYNDESFLFDLNKLRPIGPPTAWVHKRLAENINVDPVVIIMNL